MRGAGAGGMPAAGRHQPAAFRDALHTHGSTPCYLVAATAFLLLRQLPCAWNAWLINLSIWCWLIRRGCGLSLMRLFRLRWMCLASPSCQRMDQDILLSYISTAHAYHWDCLPLPRRRLLKERCCARGLTLHTDNYTRVLPSAAVGLPPRAAPTLPPLHTTPPHTPTPAAAFGRYACAPAAPLPHAHYPFGQAPGQITISARRGILRGHRGSFVLPCPGLPFCCLLPP